VGYSEDLAIEKRPKMRCNWASKSSSYFLPVPKQVVKVNGSVNAEKGFSQQPVVINGCSDLLVEVFGEKGRHARAAVGVESLPANVPVEIEIIFEVA